MKTPLTISHRRGDASHRVWAKRTVGERVALFIRRQIVADDHGLFFYLIGGAVMACLFYTTMGN